MSLEHFSFFSQMFLNQVAQFVFLKRFLLSGNRLESCDDFGVLLVEGLGFDALLFVDFLQAKVVFPGVPVFGIDVIEFLNSVLELFCDVLNLLKQHRIFLIYHLQVMLTLRQVAFQLVNNFQQVLNLPLHSIRVSLFTQEPFTGKVEFLLRSLELLVVSFEVSFVLLFLLLHFNGQLLDLLLFLIYESLEFTRMMFDVCELFRKGSDFLDQFLVLQSRLVKSLQGLFLPSCEFVKILLQNPDLLFERLSICQVLLLFPDQLFLKKSFTVPQPAHYLPQPRQFFLQHKHLILTLLICSLQL